MSAIIRPMQVAAFLCILLWGGCSYSTVQGSYEDRAREEWAAAETLKTAPDLTISGIKYAYLPASTSLDSSGGTKHPAKVKFQITIRNAGNADMTNPYFIIVRNLTPPSTRGGFYSGIFCNLKSKGFAPKTDQVVYIEDVYPPDSSTYGFTIITNSIIQDHILHEAYDNGRRMPVPPLSRELRYDNNDADITFPGLEEARRDTVGL